MKEFSHFGVAISQAKALAKSAEEYTRMMELLVGVYEDLSARFKLQALSTQAHIEQTLHERKT